MARKDELRVLVEMPPGISRAELLRRGAALGIAAPSLAALLAACGGGDGDEEAGGRPLTPTFYQWIVNLHPAIEDGVNPDFAEETPLASKIAPVQGFGIDRFVAEARDRSSTWDVYVGMTPFVEMAALIDADVIEPWDPYMPQEVRDDIIPSILEEAKFEDKIYNWPFLLDIIVQGWHAGIVEKAGIDPDTAPKTWDEYLANATKCKESGAAPFGCTFDAHGWRSLAPITHSISTDVYRPDGLFDFTSDPAVQALQLMKQMKDLANPNVLNPGTTDGGVNDTPDEGAFAAQQVAYYVKYQNAHTRMAGTWDDPTQLRLAALPSGGGGATVFWNTGAALFKHGRKKEQAAEYMQALTKDERIWENSIGSEREAAGQLPVYQSLWEKWQADRPEWMKDWAFLVFEQLPQSKAITTHKFGLSQFQIGQPQWEKYLKGAESDPRTALQATQDAVLAEVKKAK
jgi:ABC-type glycerol-3-phosphate transport system substrate-binding protein